MPGKHWTEQELSAWSQYFRQGGARPQGRELDAAIRKVKPLTLRQLSSAQRHAGATAAAAYLGRVPYRHQGEHAEFIEHAIIGALEPWRINDLARPVLQDAARAARKAIYAAPSKPLAEPAPQQLLMFEAAHG